jgi:hypothetical protein
VFHSLFISHISLAAKTCNNRAHEYFGVYSLGQVSWPFGLEQADLQLCSKSNGWNGRAFKDEKGKWHLFKSFHSSGSFQRFSQKFIAISQQYGKSTMGNGHTPYFQDVPLDRNLIVLGDL